VATPLVSIVIPVYNGAQYLSAAIDSALGQTYPNIEVLVVNDGSCDDGETARVAKRYGDRIRYEEKENGGVATALNLGIERMRGEYFAWLSHDDLYLPGRIAHQMSLIRRYGPRQLVAGGYWLVNSQLEILAPQDIRRMYTREKLDIPLFPVFHCAVNGCTMLIHKQHFDRVGLFESSLSTTQDYDLWFRMLRGQRLVYTRQLDVLSRVHDGQTSVAMLNKHQAECTELWLKLFSKLTDEEMTAMAGSVKTFYRDMYTHFRDRTSYPVVAEYLRQQGGLDQDDVYSLIQPTASLRFLKWQRKRTEKKIRQFR